MCNKIAHKKRSGKCTAMELYTDANLQEYAIFSFSDHTFSVMSLFELNNVLQDDLPKNAIAIASSSELDCSMFCLENGSLIILPFNNDSPANL